MRYVAHNYQNYAKDFILAHKVSALFLDCGLGKTITTLTAINELMYDSFEISKVLIIAPLRVAQSTWKDEIEKWDHLNLLRYSIVVGDEKERLKALKQNSDIYIINRENVDWLVTKSGIDFNFDMLIIDELSSFKSHTSKRFKSLLKIRPYFERVVGLTGTPSSNGLMDLWAEFRVLDLGERLGRYITHYRNEYFLPDKRNGVVIFSYKPQPHAEERIYRRLADMTISMKSTEYLKMPELILNDLEINLDEEDQIKYKKFKKEMVMTIQEKEIDAINAASLSNKLIQLANGSIYDDDKKFYEIHNKKLDKLEEIIESANGKPVLIAYWFKADKERIEKRFKVREIKTADDIKQWNMGMINLALIHPASTGHGLNLQSGGSTLVWFSLTWSLELYQQTNARLYRQGQKDTVVIHHLITKNTIDEDIMKSLKRKDKTQEALMRAVKARIGG
ncbi:ATP-dependent helicase HepA [Gemella morbillorum]|jgi:SNF2 family DNA or RNA helicase|uniref:DEAD/DEAH box helicase n=1 Tax=Gemella morbillorum TaxID=29391 RepID=UPI000DA3AE2F|nr:DEAD/DEAH box helicase [Gemella morbillorum]UBH80434.1 DEAD/DEAH box helicase [Gemella morbillorum]SQH55828.1 ATP-dependent helicase HepA [Gemella morbillorum]